MATPNWLDLPQDVLKLICAKLLVDMDDAARFGAVCSLWQATLSEATSNRYLLPPPPPQLPVLMLPNHGVQDDPESLAYHCTFPRQKTRSIYYLPGAKIYENILPVSAKELCFNSSEGWILVLQYKRRGRVYLLNPFLPVHSNRIPLPSVTTFELEHRQSWRILPFFHKMVLSANPLHTSNYTVMVIYGEDMRLAFCRPGENYWTCIHQQWRYFDDVIYYKDDQFYAITEEGGVVSCDVSRPPHPKVTIVSDEDDVDDVDDMFDDFLDDVRDYDGGGGDFYLLLCIIGLGAFTIWMMLMNSTLEMFIFQQVACIILIFAYLYYFKSFQVEDYEDMEDFHKCIYKKLYLVESSGELLRVRRDIIKNEVSEKYFAETARFAVYKLKPKIDDGWNWSNWSRVKTLGDRVLFLGENSSFSLSASDFKLKPDQIFFTDDMAFTLGRARVDAGVFNVKDGSILPFFVSDKFIISDLHPLWIQPTLKSCIVKKKRSSSSKRRAAAARKKVESRIG